MAFSFVRFCSANTESKTEYSPVAKSALKRLKAKSRVFVHRAKATVLMRKLADLDASALPYPTSSLAVHRTAYCINSGSDWMSSLALMFKRCVSTVLGLKCSRFPISRVASPWPIR